MPLSKKEVDVMYQVDDKLRKLLPFKFSSSWEIIYDGEFYSDEDRAFDRFLYDEGYDESEFVEDDDLAEFREQFDSQIESCLKLSLENGDDFAVIAVEFNFGDGVVLQPLGEDPVPASFILSCNTLEDLLQNQIVNEMVSDVLLDRADESDLTDLDNDEDDDEQTEDEE